MSKHHIKIETVNFITHDVLQIVTEKPPQFTFVPGQAADVTINKKGWLEEKRPFTFTSLPDNNYLEFIIKTYPSHKGVTNELLHLIRNEELIVHEVFGTIGYKGEGVFIAGGAGVTPFISIFRDLRSKHALGNNTLLFANKTKADIILEKELQEMLGNNFINILSAEEADGYAYGMITKDLIAAHRDGPNTLFYLCGPPPMMKAVEKSLASLRIPKKSIFKEEF
ncbi:MAG: ferredoxin reductase domain-containing protein [Bacteroidota bacterium]